VEVSLQELTRESQILLNKMHRALAYIRLMRPANIITSLADILLGFAASGAAIQLLKKQEWNYGMAEFVNLYFLLVSSACLYGAGVVLNDFFDLEIDKTERPERPLPKGNVSVQGALLLGIILSATGITVAFFVSILSGLISVLIVCLSLLYNKYSKNHAFWGPLNMASCRMGNLMLGLTVIPDFRMDGIWLLMIPLIYIGSVTLLSQGEVTGTEKKRIETSLLLYILLLIFILNLSFLDRFSLLYSLPFLILFILFSLPGIIKAMKHPGQPLLIRKAVKNSILGLILLDASLIAGFTGLSFGLLVVLLLPLSIILAKTFAVS